jgi:hypothetical protein
MRRFVQSLAACVFAAAAALTAVWLLTRPSIGNAFLFALEATVVLAPCAAVLLARRVERARDLKRHAGFISLDGGGGKWAGVLAGRVDMAPRERLERRLEHLTGAAELAVDDEYLTAGECSLLTGASTGIEAPGGHGQVATGLRAGELAALCEALKHWSPGPGRCRLTTFAEACEYPPASPHLATCCRDGQEFSLACPPQMLHAIVVRPYEEILAALRPLLTETEDIRRRLGRTGAGSQARRLAESVGRVGDLAVEMARDRARSAGGSENVDLALARALPRHLHPGLARDLPAALREAERDALVLVAAVKDHEIGDLPLCVGLARRLGHAAAIDASGDVGRHSTFVTFVRYPPGIETYAHYVAGRLIRHYALALALTLPEHRLPELGRFLVAVECGQPAEASASLRTLLPESDRDSAFLPQVLRELSGALDADAAAPAAWVRYVARALEGSALEDRSLGEEAIPSTASTVRVPLATAGGGVCAWSGVRLAWEWHDAARACRGHSVSSLSG